MRLGLDRQDDHQFVRYDPEGLCGHGRGIETNSLIQNLLAPDVTIDGQDTLSLGISIAIVKAMFPGLQ